MKDEFTEAIIMMRLAGNIQSEDPKVVMAVVLSILYEDSKRRDGGKP